MGRIVFEMDGRKYSIPKSDSELIALFQQFTKIEIEKTNGSTESKANVTRDKLPKIEQIEHFIKQQPQYAHDKYTVSLNFLGTELKYIKGDKEYISIYDILSKRIRRARNKIVSEEKGIWESKREGWGKPKTYVFIPKK